MPVLPSIHQPVGPPGKKEWGKRRGLYTFPQSVSITGGWPTSSYFFVSVQGDGFFLDPHHSWPAVSLRPFVGDPIPRSLGHAPSPSSSSHGHTSPRPRTHVSGARSARSGVRARRVDEARVRVGGSSFARGGSMSPEPFFVCAWAWTCGVDESRVRARARTRGHDGERARRHAPPACLARCVLAHRPERHGEGAAPRDGQRGGGVLRAGIHGGGDAHVPLRARAQDADERARSSMLLGCVCRDEAEWVDLRKGSVLKCNDRRSRNYAVTGGTGGTRAVRASAPWSYGRLDRTPGADDDDDMLESISDPGEEVDVGVDDGDVSTTSHAASSTSHATLSASHVATSTFSHTHIKLTKYDDSENLSQKSAAEADDAYSVKREVKQEPHAHKLPGKLVQNDHRIRITRTEWVDCVAESGIASQQLSSLSAAAPAPPLPPTTGKLAYQDGLDPADMINEPRTRKVWAFTNAYHTKVVVPRSNSTTHSVSTSNSSKSSARSEVDMEEDSVAPVTPLPNAHFDLGPPQHASAKGMGKGRERTVGQAYAELVEEGDGEDDFVDASGEVDDIEDDWVDPVPPPPPPVPKKSSSSSKDKDKDKEKDRSSKSKTKVKSKKATPVPMLSVHYPFPVSAEDGAGGTGRTSPRERERNVTVSPRAAGGGWTQSGGVRGILTED
ncbi:hypothetical protein C8R45DRAFT_1138240 [Mycena sanguinolenta]|nr:hypothetical protein C8R45DRAFT_1138240 [Mycena sanguinolenta]